MFLQAHLQKPYFHEYHFFHIFNTSKRPEIKDLNLDSSKEMHPDKPNSS